MSLRLGYRTRSSGMSMRSAPARAISISSSEVAPITVLQKDYRFQILMFYSSDSMFRRLLTLAWSAAAAVSVATMQAPSYDRFFTRETMRLDYVHSGGPDGEAFKFERIISDGPWAGSRASLIDDSNLGAELFEASDL